MSYSARDTHAASPGYTSVIPRRHVARFFDPTPEAVNACMEMITAERELMNEGFKPGGCNIGANVGPAARQSIFHAHITSSTPLPGRRRGPQGACGM